MNKLEKFLISKHTDMCNAEPLEFEYKNWKGEVSIRKVYPDYIWYGHTEYHIELQYFMRAFDVNKDDYRDFAILDIIRYIE